MPCHHHAGTITGKRYNNHTYKSSWFKIGKRILNVTGGIGAVADGTSLSQEAESESGFQKG